MYTLFYDEFTGQYFVGNVARIEANLNLLRKKVMRKFSFTMNEYCDALGIPHEDPFGTYEVTAASFDIPFLFDLNWGLVGEIPVIRVEIAG